MIILVLKGGVKFHVGRAESFSTILFLNCNSPTVHPRLHATYSTPVIVNVFPEPAWPYINSVALTPSSSTAWTSVLLNLPEFLTETKKFVVFGGLRKSRKVPVSKALWKLRFEKAETFLAFYMRSIFWEITRFLCVFKKTETTRKRLNLRKVSFRRKRKSFRLSKNTGVDKWAATILVHVVLMPVWTSEPDDSSRNRPYKFNIKWRRW